MTTSLCAIKMAGKFARAIFLGIAASVRICLPRAGRVAEVDDVPHIEVR